MRGASTRRVCREHTTFFVRRCRGWLVEQLHRLNGLVREDLAVVAHVDREQLRWLFAAVHFPTLKPSGPQRLDAVIATGALTRISRST